MLHIPTGLLCLKHIQIEIKKYKANARKGVNSVNDFRKFALVLILYSSNKILLSVCWKHET
jgi:hypothetical protein